MAGLHWHYLVCADHVPGAGSKDGQCAVLADTLDQALQRVRWHGHLTPDGTQHVFCDIVCVARWTGRELLGRIEALQPTPLIPRPTPPRAVYVLLADGVR